MPEPAERTQTTVLTLGPRRGISLKIYRHFLVVAVCQFGDTFEHRNFLLDTGATPSILNARLVKRLGLSTDLSRLERELGIPLAGLFGAVEGKLSP